MGKPLKKINEVSLKILQNYSWPGNVRELQNLLEREVVLTDKTMIEIQDEDFVASLAPKTLLSKKGKLNDALEEVEKALILQALQDNHGIQSRAARSLGLSRSTLQYKVTKHNLESYCRDNP
jgi:DNA-binding NtrC family response regulator